MAGRENVAHTDSHTQNRIGDAMHGTQIESETKTNEVCYIVNGMNVRAKKKPTKQNRIFRNKQK